MARDGSTASRFESVYRQTVSDAPAPVYPGDGQHPDLDADITQIAAEDVPALIHRCFWRQLDLDIVPQPLDAAIFGLAVHAGIAAAVTALQRALNRMVLAKGDLKIDGLLERQTMARIGMAMRQQHGIDKLIVRYRQEASLHYNDLVRANTGKVIHLADWQTFAEGLGRV